MDGLPNFEAQQATLVLFACFRMLCHNQVSLRSLIYILMCCALGGTLGCRPNLLGDFIPKPHLRFAAVESGFYAPAVRQVTLCSLTTFSLFRFVLGTIGLPPKPA